MNEYNAVNEENEAHDEKSEFGDSKKCGTCPVRAECYEADYSEHVC